uniref:Uncharacterized protein n=2 Tax=Meloidogyne TaxID=189290 RepID=A0A6V7UWZ5_MELEN|nr:unnamed protein product [Meloidogyne enterolobii]
MNVLEKRPPVVTDLTEEKQQQQHLQETVCDKEILPTAIIIRDVPKELFDDPEQKSNFRSLFQQITCDTDPIRIDFLKSFQRVRIVFEKPEHATAAKLLVEHHSFNGAKMKAFFAKNIKMARRVDQDEQGHLKLPPLEKQFLISPPSSPPVGWVQHAEMAPVVCNLDLMSRLASLAVDDKFELYEGDEHQRRPSIVVTPCGIDGDGRGKSSIFGRRVVSMDSSNNINVVGENDSDSANSESEQQILPPTKVQMPHTPRPPTCNKE